MDEGEGGAYTFMVTNVPMHCIGIWLVSLLMSNTRGEVNVCCHDQEEAYASNGHPTNEFHQ